MSDDVFVGPTLPPQGRLLLYSIPGVPLETLHLAVELAEAEGLAPVPVQAWVTLGNVRRLPIPLHHVVLGEGGAGLALGSAGWVDPVP